MSNLSDSFRFIELPAEIRNKIYRELLCKFTCEREPDGRPDSVLARLMREKEMLNGVCEAVHDVTISILLVNRQIHREAYDVMVKTNQFIRVRGHDFNFSEFLLRGQLPVVTMDRAHAAQFQAYLLCIDVSGGHNFADDVPIARFDFIILGRHWEHLCLCFSHLYAALPEYGFHLGFNPAPVTAYKDHKAPIESTFLVKAQGTLLNYFKTHLRGIPALEIDGVINTELSESVKREVGQMPFDDIEAWFCRLEQQCQLGSELLEQKKTIEASVVWTNVLGDMSWVWEEITPSEKDRFYQILYTCQMGETRCFLHHLEYPPGDYTDIWVETMANHAVVSLRSMDHTVAKIRSAGKIAKTDGDAMDAKNIILLCRILRLKLMRMNQPMPLAGSQDLACYLLKASQLAPHDNELEEERQKLIESSGLEGLTLEDIANAL